MGMCRADSVRTPAGPPPPWKDLPEGQSCCPLPWTCYRVCAKALILSPPPASPFCLALLVRDPDGSLHFQYFR